jgi:hypothetical protein
VTPRRRAKPIWYEYTNEAGIRAHATKRELPKKFTQWHWAGGAWVPGGIREPYIYNLPAVLRAARDGKSVWICDGEKDCDAMAQKDAVATCCPNGMKSWKPHMVKWLDGAKVIVVVDQDGGAGIGQAQHLVGLLNGSVTCVRAAEGKDAADHIAAGLGLADFIEMRLPVSRSDSAVKGSGSHDVMYWVHKYIGEVHNGKGRQEAAFELSCQLRDDGWTTKQVQPGLNFYYRAVKDLGGDFEFAEVKHAWESANQRGRRDPVAAKGGNEERTLELRAFDTFEERSLDWLWYPYIPFGKITILDGDPGLGKSLLWMDLMARLSSGTEMPLGSPIEDPMKCIVMSAEDEIEDTILPRLRAHGANLSNIFSVALRSNKNGVVPFTLPEDLHALCDAVDRTGARFVVTDPVTAYFSDRISTNNDAQVRKAMTPLAIACSDQRFSLLSVRHLNKSSKEHKAIYRGGGSIAITGAARSALLLAWADENSPEREMILAQAKANLVRHSDARSLRCKVEAWPEDDRIPHMSWLGIAELGADDLLSKADGRMSAPVRDEAIALLRNIFLHIDVVSQREVKKYASEAGISWPTMKNAKALLPIVSEAVHSDGKFAEWTWKWTGVR